jgi:hypothetical protein
MARDHRLSSVDVGVRFELGKILVTAKRTLVERLKPARKPTTQQLSRTEGPLPGVR